MTWILANEQEIVRSSSTDVTDIAAWTDYFYLTYLPTRGYTVTKGNVGADVYYGVRKTVTTRNGAILDFAMVHEWEYSTFDTVCYNWPAGETDPTVVGSSVDSQNSAPILIFLGTYKLQIWESDQDSHSFYVRRTGVATNNSSGTNSLAMSFPMNDCTVLTSASDYYEGWFVTNKTKFGSSLIVVEQGKYGADGGFVSNAYTLSYATVQYGELYNAISTDIFFVRKTPSTSQASGLSINSGTVSSEAVIYNGEYYIDLNAKSNSLSIMLKTGAVNPEA